MGDNQDDADDESSEDRKDLVNVDGFLIRERQRRSRPKARGWRRRSLPRVTRSGSPTLKGLRKVGHPAPVQRRRSRYSEYFVMLGAYAKKARGCLFLRILVSLLRVSRVPSYLGTSFKVYHPSSCQSFAPEAAFTPAAFR